MYTVVIKYTGPVAELPNSSTPICSLFKPTGSYIDSPAYDGTKFDSNVTGFGTVPFDGGYAQTLALAMFKLAIIAANDGKSAEFEVNDAKEAAYYELVGKAISDQGFEVEVKKK